MSITSAPVVGVGSFVTIQDLRNHDEFTLTLIDSGVGADDPDTIPHDSPVGRALVGGRVGAIVGWSTPEGLARFRIIAIDRGTP